MSDISKDISDLSPEKRELLELLLAEEGIDIDSTFIIPQKREWNETLSAYVMPMSFAQQRLWFLDQFESEKSLYNIPLAMKFTGNLDIEIFEKCVRDITLRHESLRTTFIALEDQPQQVINPEPNYDLRSIDLTHVAGEELDQLVQKQLLDEARKPFNLEVGPLFRVVLLKTGVKEYIAVFTMHHIISDGWSMGVLSREFVQLYIAYSKGENSPLEILPIQYADYAVWQQNWFKGEIYETQLNFWVDQLGKDQPIINLPADYQRPAVKLGKGASLNFAISESQSNALLELSNRLGTTLFVTTFAVFATLLHRYSSQFDIRVGTPVAGRNRREIEGLIGFFVNTLVLKADFSGSPTFRELVTRLKQVSLDAYSNQDLPFEMLVEALQPERDMSHPPIFQVMFALQNAPKQRWNLPGLLVENIPIHSNTSKFDISLYLNENRGQESEYQITGSLEYDTELFEQATLERLVKHLQTLIDGIVEDPERPLTEISLLSEAEKKQIIIDWNDTVSGESLEHTIHGLVERRVEQVPDEESVIDGEESVTYGELNKCANQVAYYLGRQGVRPGELVGICMNRSIDLVVSLLGILKAGGAYVPIDPNYPKERQEFMVKDAGVRYILTNSDLEGVIPALVENMISVDGEWSEIERMPETNPGQKIDPSSLAYVLFTSGSTGLPKGVAIEHRSAVALIQWAKSVYSAEDLAGVLFSTSISFDLSVYELFVTLSLGGKVILAENALELAELSNAGEVTLINTVPSAISELLQADAIPASVRVVNLAGEPLRAELVDKLYEIGTIERVYDLYGPSEDTTYSTYALREAHGREIIGKPIDNTQIYILDKYHQPVPVGVPGELYIGGAGVARGYLNRPELTTERFLPNPFNSIFEEAGIDLPGDGRFYRTGDLVRYLADGNVEFLGRIDQQVKLRGFRIELGEIETLLSNHPTIEDSVVWVWEKDGTKRLVGYVVQADGEVPISVAEIREYLGGKLPEYMVPTVFVFLDKLPLTPNGKVDRNALPAPELSRDDLKTDYVPATTPEEKMLAQIWAEVLGYKKGEDIGINDNFFELGGDSILTIQVIAKANQIGLRLTPRQLFEHPTLSGLAREVEGGIVVEAEQGLVEGEVLLTPIQRWFFEQNLPRHDHYNQALLFKTQPDIKLDILKQAVLSLILHHDALRLRFEPKNGDIRQSYIGSEDEGINNQSFSLIDLSNIPDDEMATQIENSSNQIQSSLNLQDGPVFRVVVFNLGGIRSNRILIVAHHLVIDGLSWRILLEDLQTAYYQLDSGYPVSLPPKTTSYKKWAENLELYAQSQDMATELEYWTRLDDLQLGRLEVDFPDGNNLEKDLTSVSVSLTEDETRALLYDVPSAYHTEINDILLTALVQTIGSSTGMPDLLIEMEGHGREDLFDDVDISRTVGWFTTIYPVRLSYASSIPLGDLIKSVKEQLREIPNNGIGYGLLRYLGDENTKKLMKNLPVPEIIFNYLGQFDQALPKDSLFSLASESRGADRDGQGVRGKLLDITGGILKGRLSLEWRFSSELFTKATIESLANSYLRYLRMIIDHCISPEAEGFTPSDFPLADLDQKDLDSLIGKLKI